MAHNTHKPQILFEPLNSLAPSVSRVLTDSCENGSEHAAPLLIVGVSGDGDANTELGSAVTTCAAAVAGGDISEALPSQPSSQSEASHIAAAGLDNEHTAQLTSVLRSIQAGSATGSITSLPAPWHSQMLIEAVGIGAGTSDDLRQAAGAAVQASLKHLRAGQDIVLAIAHTTMPELQAIAQGALLGAYSFDTYKKKHQILPNSVRVVTSIADSVAHNSVCDNAHREYENTHLRTLAERIQIIAEATWAVRDLVNTPTSDLNTEELTDIAVRTAEEAGCSVRVWNTEQLYEDKLEGLLAVGAGSAHEPRLVRIEWSPSSAKSFIALVGKGITYDTGGYSLKPRTAMTSMKTDMTGAATVLQTIIAAARLGLPHKIVAWLCIAENMVSSTAQRVDDVITYRNGITVEVTNTDAEGRLVLADGLIMACEEAPDAVIDIATLTGAQIVALGNRYTGVMGSDDIRERLTAAADAAGELAWGMPLPCYLQHNLASPIADMANSASSREAGMMVAGAFLKNFVNPDISWGHLDIAGPAFLDKAWGYNPRGATGVMVRTLVEFIERS